MRLTRLLTLYALIIVAGPTPVTAQTDEGQNRSTPERHTLSSSTTAPNLPVTSDTGLAVQTAQASKPTFVSIERAVQQLETVVAELSPPVDSTPSGQSPPAKNTWASTQKIAKLSAEIRQSLEEIKAKYQTQKGSVKSQAEVAGPTITTTGNVAELPLDEVIPVASELESVALRVQKLTETLQRAALTRKEVTNEIGTAFSELAKARLQTEEAKTRNTWSTVESATRRKFGILVAIHVLVLFGIGFAVEEFVAASNIRKKATNTQNHIEVGRERIALRTALHGTVIFALTLLTYFLALALLYPLKLL